MHVFQTKISSSVDEALSYLEAGECVGIPTETVYGLAADACSSTAVQKIYHSKGRPNFNPLIIHVDSIEMAMQYGHFNEVALELVYECWQNQRFADLHIKENMKKQQPFTFVVPLKDNIKSVLASEVTAGLKTVAIRSPSHPVALDLIKRLGRPLAAPSANRSNYISPTTAKAVFEDLKGRIPFVLDAGPCAKGIESTILDLTTLQPVVLRYGSGDLNRINEVLNAYQQGLQVEEKQTSVHMHMKAIRAPGMLQKHYAPKTPVRLNAREQLAPTEAYLAFGQTPAHIKVALNLSETANLEEASVNLYHMLRELDQRGYNSIAIAPIPNTGLGMAINDRLKRAAAS